MRHFSSMGVRNGVDASGSYAKPTFCNTRATFRGDTVTTLLEFPAILLGAAEPPLAAELLAAEPPAAELSLL